MSDQTAPVFEIGKETDPFQEGDYLSLQAVGGALRIEVMEGGTHTSGREGGACITITPAAAVALAGALLERAEPQSLVWSPRDQAYRIQGYDRLVKRIGCEVDDRVPSKEDPLPKYAVAMHPGHPLSPPERFLVALFMVGRWIAWAALPADEDASTGQGSRIIRPH